MFVRHREVFCATVGPEGNKHADISSFTRADVAATLLYWTGVPLRDSGNDMSHCHWLLRVNDRPRAAVRLVCVPHAGSGAASFAGWRKALPLLDMSVVQLPGSGARLREPFCPSIHDAADAIVDALCPMDERQTIVFGHSMGALIGFEIARRLDAAGAPLAALMVAARRAPSLPERTESIAHLPPALFAERMQARYGAIPAEVMEHAELRDLFVPVLRAQVAMVEAYRYTPAAPVKSPIVAYGGDADPHVPLTDLAPWSRETLAAASVRRLSGGHFFVQTARARLMTLVRHDIDQTFLGAH